MQGIEAKRSNEIIIIILNLYDKRAQAECCWKIERGRRKSSMASLLLTLCLRSILSSFHRHIFPKHLFIPKRWNIMMKIFMAYYTEMFSVFSLGSLSDRKNI